MTLNQKLTSGIATLLVTVANTPLLHTRPAIATPQQLAQVTPSTVTGTLNSRSRIHFDGSYFNIHTFEGTAGEVVRIDMTSAEFDAYLILFGPGGGRITQDNSSGGGTNARIVITLPTTGTYQIAANAYRAGETGQYTLTWEPTTAQEAAAAPAADLTQIFGQILSGSSAEEPEDVIAQALLGVLLSQQPTAATGNQGSALQRATRLNQQAIALYQAGRYDEAEPLLQEAISIWRTEVGDRGPGMSNGLSGLALIYRTQSRYAEAEALYEEALSIDRENLGDHHPDVAANLGNLAAVYRNQSRYGEAEAAYQEAINIWRGQTGNQPLRFADDLRALAGIYASQGRYEVGEPLVQEALSIYRTQNQPVGIAASLANLATLYYEQGKYDGAETFLQEALAIERANLSSNDPRIGNSLNNLGLVYLAQNRYQEAEASLQNALQIRREDGNDPAIAQTLNNIAMLYYEQRQFDQAEPLLLEALSIRREFAALTGETFVVDEPLIDLARLYTSQGNLAQAINALEEGLDIQERYLNINFSTTADRQRQAYAATLSEATDQAITLSINAAPESLPAAQLALTTLLRRKGRVLEAGISNLQAIRQNLTAADQATLDELVSVRQQLGALTFNRRPDLPPDQYRARLRALGTQENELASTLARRSNLFRAETTPVEIAAIQAQLPSNSALLEYVRYSPFDAESNQWGQPRYAVYLLFPNGRIQAVDLGNASEIDAAVQAFVGLLQNQRVEFQRAGATPTIRPDIVEGVTEDLKVLVFDPIASYLQDTDHLLISPDGQLNLLPFEALQAEIGGDYLVQQYQISYLNSGRDLLKFDAIEPSRNPAVVLANPDYETADGTVQFAQGRSTGSNRRSTELSQLQVGPLPGTAAEAEAIAPLLPNAEIFLGDKATENVLKSVQAPRILHVATHGFFLPNVEHPTVSSAATLSGDYAFGSEVAIENPLLRSGLALAGFNPRRSGSEDGVLTALESSSLNLFGTQLVVLSACETGLGDIANGEGVYGLRRAFAIAGAETQLMSLWNVSDFGTQSLMARYYARLTAGSGRSEALRDVQLEMIEQGGQYSHPYYWAAFILAGDWRPLD
ncbi:MAG: CHAT domain-containing protein [Leptolyngbyaceae cyanobacterium]